jgi:hypothetical protein
VCDAKQHEDDETAYLLKSSANRERLLKAIENVTQNRRLITVTLDELRGYPKSKGCANMVQSWMLLPFHGGLPNGCHTS